MTFYRYIYPHYSFRISKTYTTIGKWYARNGSAFLQEPPSHTLAKERKHTSAIKSERRPKRTTIVGARKMAGEKVEESRRKGGVEESDGEERRGEQRKRNKFHGKKMTINRMKNMRNKIG